MRLVCEGAVGCVRPASLLERLCSQDLHPSWQARLGHSPEAFCLSSGFSVSIIGLSQLRWGHREQRTLGKRTEDSLKLFWGWLCWRFLEFPGPWSTAS